MSVLSHPGRWAGDAMLPDVTVAGDEAVKPGELVR